MDFISDFYSNLPWAAAFGLLFFTLPGLWCAALLGFSAHPWREPAALFIAPLLGLIVYGVFSLLVTWAAGFSFITLSGAWISFQALAAWYLYRKRSIYKENGAPFFTLPRRWSFVLLLAAALAALAPSFNIMPVVQDGALFVNVQIFDHMKIAVVDGIARQGMPPVNPFYAPEGQSIELIYYYAWHFLAAQVKLLAAVSGWQADAALTWLTSFAGFAFLSGLALRFGGRVRAGIFMLLLVLCGSPAEILPLLFGERWRTLLGYPPEHPLELLWMQLSWAPQHVFAAFSTLILLFMTARVFAAPALKWPHAVLIGVTAAMGFNSSIWVGGVALLIVFPVLLFALWRHAPSREQMPDMLKPFAGAFALCVVFSLPVLSAQLSGPAATSGGFPLAFKLSLGTALFGLDSNSSWRVTGHVILFWVQFLPLTFGIAYVLGLFSLAAYKIDTAEGGVFKYLSIAAVFSYLLAVQGIHSVIYNNDFGWRSAAVPVLFLMVWAAVALSRLSGANSRRQMLLFIVYVGLSLGLLSSAHMWFYPVPHHPPSEENLAERRDFFMSRHAWEEARRYSEPHELVQANPDTYSTIVTPWHAPADLALFADRPTAYASPEYVHVMAHPYSKEQKERQYRLVQNLFSNTPLPENIRHAREVLKIKVLIVDKRDPVWHSSALEDSGLYRLVSRTKHYRIYAASS